MKQKESYSSEDIDGFVGHNPKDGYMAWVPVEDGPSKAMSIRFQEPEAPSPNVNWANEYSLERNFP